jgi:gamma-glutamyltranspeptidase/glutathione hydrolase
VPVQELLSKQYARQRAALIRPDSAIQDPQPGTFENSSPSADAAPAGADLGSTTYFTVVDKDHNAVSFINSLYEHFGSGVTAGDTGVMMQDRGSQFSLDPSSPNVIAPGKRPFHTIIPAMVFKDGKPLFSFGVMGGNMQPQGHVEVLTRIIDLGMGLQEAIDGPRFRYDGGARVIMEDAMGADVIAALERRGHKRATVPNVRSAMGGAQLIMIDPQTGALAGASDPRKDGQAVGW